MEMLSQCQGWLEGYLLTGGHGLFSSKEALIHIIDSMFTQHARWLNVCNEIPWRRSFTRTIEGNVALFAHGHVLRVPGALWLGLPSGAGQHFLLDTGTVSVLGYYRNIRPINKWSRPAAG